MIEKYHDYQALQQLTSTTLPLCQKQLLITALQQLTSTTPPLCQTQLCIAEYHSLATRIFLT
jgi:hypothetical protein